jgi:hypothetical protein
VFASLKLSYFHLADNLKQCFTFCSIFPKGYKIVKNHLIAQWMAHGFIMNKEDPEDIGSEYFDSLVKVGFLQDSFQVWHNDQPVYKMHDLIHDLARLVSQDELLTSVPKNITTNCTHRCRYLSLTSSTEMVDKGLFDKVRALYVYGGDLSFDKSIKSSFYVRSVILQSTVVGQFSILKSKCLGYLEICHVSFTEFPEAISGCWNLQALHVMYCRGFTRLPQSIGKLKKLRTLEFFICNDFESLPQSIGDCRGLRCLQLYFCSNLRDIPNSICKLENLKVIHITASPAVQQLPSKLAGDLSNLQTLDLSGCSRLKDLPSTFACCPLRNLVLSNTNITGLPEWITLICTLECIELEYCTELEELPTDIGNLKRLEVLNIQGCWKLCGMPLGFGQLIRLRRLGMFVVGRGENDANILELGNLDMLCGELEITNLRYLRDPSGMEKASLKQKKNMRCLKLTWWSSSGMEEELISDMEQELGVLCALEPPPEIMMLEISGYGGPGLPCWMSKQCDSFYLENKTSTPPRFHGLTQLMLEHLPNLKHMRGLVELPSLKTFNLHGMPSLEELWTTTNGLEIGEDEVGVQYCFPVLSTLFIGNCPKLNVKPYFPRSLEQLRLRKSNEQLVSPGGCSSSSCQFHPRSDESPPSCGTLAEVHLKKLKLEEMTASSSGWELLQQLTKLETLEIRLCNDLREFPESMRHLRSL